MPIDPISKSLYPVVPQALGVPTLLRSGARILDTITLGYLGAGAALDQIIGAEPVKWAVLDPNGDKLAPYDSVFAIGYMNDSRISDYPIENGSFNSYNKVDTPFDIVVTLTCAGSDSDRTSFINSIEASRKSLVNYSVLTPEYTYQNVNFTSIRWQRAAREGAYVILAELTGREVRDKAKSSYSEPKSLAAYDPKQQGQVQLINDPSFDATGAV